MATQDLNEPLLPKPSLSDSKTFLLTSFLVTLALIALAHSLIKDSPACDQPLVLWTQWLLGLLILSAGVCLLRLVLGRVLLVVWMHQLVGLGVGVMWVWGHWLAYGSEECEQGLWCFVFVIVVLGDTIVVLLCLGVCVVCLAQKILIFLIARH